MAGGGGGRDVRKNLKICGTLFGDGDFIMIREGSEVNE